MTYRASNGVRGSGRIAPLEKDRWPSKQFLDLDQALEWAGCVARKGTVVLAIKWGDDGTQLTKHEIAAGLAGRAQIQFGDGWGHYARHHTAFRFVRCGSLDAGQEDEVVDELSSS